MPRLSAFADNLSRASFACWALCSDAAAFSSETPAFCSDASAFCSAASRAVRSRPTCCACCASPRSGLASWARAAVKVPAACVAIFLSVRAVSAWASAIWAVRSAT